MRALPSAVVLLCVVFTARSAAAADRAANAAPRPNLILINIDDLGYGDIGPFGSKSNRTPNFDRMAAQGRKLACHYAAPVCSPSRASLMTGCYPKRVLPIPHVLFPAAAVGLHPDELTVAEVLKEAGYATACIGKWHLGDQPEFLPTRQGFDYYFGLPYSNDMGPAADGAKSNPGEPLPATRPGAPATRPNAPARRNAPPPPADDETGIKGGQPPLPLLENEKVIERVRAEEQPTLTRRYTEKALRFISDNKGRPFFLYLPHTAVHFPLYPSPEFKGKSKNGLIGDWVEETDAAVGQVLRSVEELKLADRTLVIFTSDNGGSIRQGSSNGPLRGTKGQTFEGGIRVPTIAWWPGKVPAGTSTDQVTSMMDVLPTFAKLAGAKLPAGRKIDGRDVWPILAGQPVAAAGARQPFFYYRGLKLEAVRRGDWKLHLQAGQLYNLARDVGESTDVAAANDEVVKTLRALAEATRDDLGLDGVGPGCRPLGRVKEAKPAIGQDGKVRDGLGAKSE